VLQNVLNAGAEQLHLQNPHGVINETASANMRTYKIIQRGFRFEAGARRQRKQTSASVTIIMQINAAFFYACE